MATTKCPKCGKGDIAIVSGGFPTCNDHSVFECERCDWKSPTGNFQHEASKAQHPWKRKPIKKQHPHEDSPELIEAIRAEFHKRRDLCIAEREKFPPSLIEKRVKITKGKNKGKTKKVWVSNPKFTDEMREHMHAFAFSPEDIRAELITGGKS